MVKFRDLSLRSKILLTSSVTLLLIALLAVLSYRSTNELTKTARWVAHTHDVISQSNHLERLIIDLETGQRGFLVTSKESFLDPYEQAVTEIPQLFEQLRLTVSDNPPQVKQVTAMETATNKWLNTYGNPIIQMEKAAIKSGLQSSHQQIIDLAATGKGKALMDQVRKEFDTFILVEKNLLKQRTEISKQSTTLSSAIISYGAAITIFLSLLISVLFMKSVTTHLNYLVRATTNIAQGNYNEPVKKHTEDEIGALSSSIETMRQAIYESNKIRDFQQENLERTNEELEKFAYITSHDLKAPLRGIGNLVSFIEEDLEDYLSQEGDTQDDIKKNFERIATQTTRMQNLINGILKYTRAGSESKTQAITIKDHVDELVSDLSDSTSITFTNHCPNTEIQIDCIPLSQVLSNLLSNAVKYHHQENDGHIQIHYSDQGSHHEFTVQDNGPGIDAEFHERIFNMFQTLQPKDEIESTGIGLSIVKKIIEQKGGQIRVESEEQSGSRFIFTWPKVENDRHALSSINRKATSIAP